MLAFFSEICRNKLVWRCCVDHADLSAWFIPSKDPAPGLGRAPLPRRGPAPPPPPLRGDRSGAAPGPRLEAESEGALDPIRPKGLGFCGLPRCQ